MPPWGSQSVAAGNRARARRLSWVLLPFVLFCAAPGRAGQAPALRRARLEVVYSSSLFRTVSRNDAIAAMRVWVATVGRKKGFELDSAVSVLENLSEIRRRVQEGPPGVVLLDPVEYFEISELGLLEPAFFGGRGKSEQLLELLLIAHQDSGATGIADLRGKSAIAYASSRADLGRKWIEVLLHENGLGPADRFFGSLNSVSNPSAAVLPVFFGKAAASVVDRGSFEVMKEMNPQLGSKLRVLASSPPFLNGLLCLDRRRIDYREELIQALRELDQDPVGRQILLVFRSNKLEPVSAEALTRVRTLYDSYRSISEKTAGSGRAAPATGRHAESGGALQEVNR